jgi:hypothetical protein
MKWLRYLMEKSKMKTESQLGRYKLTIITHKAMDQLLKQGNPADVIDLYAFYYYTAMWQKTNQAWATTGYVAKGLHWSIARVRKAKSKLNELGLIEEVQARDSKGKITGHYIKVKYLWKRSTLVANGIDPTIATEINPLDGRTTLRSSQPVVEKPTNALNDNNLNALSGGSEKHSTSPSSKSQLTGNQQEAGVGSSTQAFGEGSTELTTIVRRNMFRNKSPVVPPNEPDPNPELTHKLIRMYAKLINNKDFEPNRRQKPKFIEASKKLIEFFKNKGLCEKNWVHYLRGCLYANYTDKGDVLYPGNLSSNHTWSVLIPQYLIELGVE